MNNKKIFLGLSILLILIITPKPYYITTTYSTSPKQDYLAIMHNAEEHGFCIGIIYPIKSRISVENIPEAKSGLFAKAAGRYEITYTTKGWKCKGYKFVHKPGELAI